MGDKPRVHVAVPTYGAVPGISMLAFGSFIGNGVAAGVIHWLGQIEGAYIDRARNDLVRQAIANDATHVLFVDQDMVLPEGLLPRLLAHQVGIVGGSYWGKDSYRTPVSFHLDPFHRIYELEDCPAIDTPAALPVELEATCWCGKPGNHIHSVGGTGMGCTLIEISLLKMVDEKYQDQKWFSTLETGEDIHLAERIASLGIARYLDGFVQCGHVATQIIKRDDYEWVKKNAPRCVVCGRVAFWHQSDEVEEGTESRYCWEHRHDRDRDAGLHDFARLGA